MTAFIDIQHASTFPADQLPSDEQLMAWASAAMAAHPRDCEITLRLVDEPEITHLNAQYRNKNKPTNVLAFPTDVPHDLDADLLGDVILCLPVAAQEAQKQNKPFEHHVAHLIIHGVLHLLGYDHTTPEEAEQMEPLEAKILSTFNIRDPYTPEH